MSEDDGEQIQKLISEKLAEQRSLETLLRIQFSDLKTDFKHNVRKWGYRLSIFLAILGIIGYPTIAGFIRSQVASQLQSKLITPEVEKTVRKALEDQTKDFVSDKINPLNQQITQMKNDLTKLESMTKSISSIGMNVEQLREKLNVAEKDLKKLSDAQARLQTMVAKSEDLLRAGNLSILARNGSGEAYDQLMVLARSTQNPDIRMLSITTQNQLFLEMNQPFYSERHFKEKKSNQELLKLFEDSNPMIRKAAIDDLVALGDKSIVPRLLEKAEHDPLILVRHAAFQGLKVLTGQEIEALQIEQWKAWYEKNKSNWPPKK